jgi:hypothetical protein
MSLWSPNSLRPQRRLHHVVCCKVNRVLFTQRVDGAVVSAP